MIKERKKSEVRYIQNLGQVRTPEAINVLISIISKCDFDLYDDFKEGRPCYFGYLALKTFIEMGTEGEKIVIDLLSNPNSNYIEKSNFEKFNSNITTGLQVLAKSFSDKYLLKKIVKNAILLGANKTKNIIELLLILKRLGEHELAAELGRNLFGEG